MGLIYLFGKDEEGFWKGTGIRSQRQIPYDGSGCHTYVVIAIRLRLFRGTFLERYRGVNTASLPSEGDEWVPDS